MWLQVKLRPSLASLEVQVVVTKGAGGRYFLGRFFGDLPLILLTDQSWLRIQPWAHEYECQLAAAADALTLTDILNNWRNRRREEQHQLLESMALTERGSARRVLQAWLGLAGKEMRSKIETALSTLA